MAPTSGLTRSRRGADTIEIKDAHPIPYTRVAIITWEKCQAPTGLFPHLAYVSESQLDMAFSRNVSALEEIGVGCVLDSEANSIPKATISFWTLPLHCSSFHHCKFRRRTAHRSLGSSSISQCFPKKFTISWSRTRTEPYIKPESKTVQGLYLRFENGVLHHVCTSLMKVYEIGKVVA